MPNVLIYTAKNCQHSKQAKKFLRRNDVDFVEKDVSQNEDFLNEMINKTGKALVPVIDLGNDILLALTNLRRRISGKGYRSRKKL